MLLMLATGAVRTRSCTGTKRNRPSLAGVPIPLSRNETGIASKGKFMPRQSDFAFARAVDVLVAAFMLAATAPLLLAVAAAIKLDSEGPLFASGCGGRLRFRTHRIGRNGAVIERGALGELLWAARLDELPLFVSLLRGDVSLFGEHALQLGFNG
jgi:lipopolysaccharide/colanic/teichoic acid biosynthesis glycosyltransferase